MTVHAQPCDDGSLRLLLAGDETSAEYRQVASHVETCPACQSRLTELAADASWWAEAQSLLDDDLDLRWEPDTSDPSLFQADASHGQLSDDDAVRQWIGPPRHPELLGRLGRYDVERVIGSGGMGIVVKAHDSELNRPVAIKLLAAHLAHLGAARERFAREGRAAAAVVHEHVVAIYNVESDDATPFLVMQYVPGRSLQARVDDDGPLDTGAILRIGMQAAAGLAAAHHQGLVHRDVKPSNILLEDSVERAVLTDFGLARTLDDATLTQIGILAGTPHYMSPEQALGRQIDHRSDLFSLGAVLYFMATGHPPFRAAGPLAVLHRICQDRHRPVWQSDPTIPDELSDLIDRLLEKKPAKRPATAAAVQEQLASLLSRWQSHGLRRHRRWRWRHLRRPVVVGIAALALAATVTAATLLLPLPLGEGRVATGDSPWRGEGALTSDAAAFERRAAPFLQADNQFATELQNVQRVLTGIPPETFYLQGDDSWARELEALKHDVTQMELNNR